MSDYNDKEQLIFDTFMKIPNMQRVVDYIEKSKCLLDGSVLINGKGWPQLIGSSVDDNKLIKLLNENSISLNVLNSDVEDFYANPWNHGFRFCYSSSLHDTSDERIKQIAKDVLVKQKEDI